MAATVTSLVLVCALLHAAADTVEWPIAIQALKPAGIRILFPDIQGVQLYVFQGNVNEFINDHAWSAGTISVDLNQATDGRWLYEDLETTLAPGDVIHYYYYYTKTGEGIQKVDEQSFTVKELVDPETDIELPLVTCHATATQMRGGEVCGGQVIFEDDFEGGKLREDLWTMEQYIPDEPDYTFVSYQHPPNAPTILVNNGQLGIEPKLLQSLPSYKSQEAVTTGTLNLTEGCTSDLSVECETTTFGASILPPIVSGRITTKKFGFIYGTVKIRAKLPLGDWLYPDILLQSRHTKHGANYYDTGVIRIAGARGNARLTGGTEEYGNKVLYAAVIPNVACRSHLQNSTLSARAWADDFHVFSFRWTPDSFTFFVDGEVWHRVTPNGSLSQMFPAYCQLPNGVKGDKMSPFDDYFGITLGVGAGGILEFEDDLVSRGVPKPWKNAGRKALLRFWQNMKSWWPWQSPGLMVDYVRVRAL